MNRKIIIGVLAAALVALGVVAFLQTRKKMATEKEISKVPESAENVPESVTDLPTPPKEPDPVPELPAGAVPAPTSQPARTARTGHFEISVPYANREAQDLAASLDGISNAEREKRIRQAFASQSKFVSIDSLSCRDTICTMEAHAPVGVDGAAFQNAIVSVITDNPWIGNKIDVTTASNNPREGRFIFFHEIPK